MNTIELLPASQSSEQDASPPARADGASPPTRRSSSTVLVFVWLSLLKFWAVLLLAGVVTVAVVPELPFLALVGAIVAPPYLLFRRLRARE